MHQIEILKISFAEYFREFKQLSKVYETIHLAVQFQFQNDQAREQDADFKDFCLVQAVKNSN